MNHHSLILLALRSDRDRSQAIFIEIEILLKGYLEADLGDEAQQKISLN